MKQLLAMLLLVAAIITSANAQDQIITTDGQVIRALITEINEDAISYKNYDNQDSPTYTISKKSVNKIIFESGIEESFSNSGQHTDIYNSDSTSVSRKVTQPDKLYLTDGTIVDCEVVEKKRFGISYIPVRSSDNYTEYISNSKVSKIVYANGETEYISGTPDRDRIRKNPRDFSYLSPHYVSVNIGPGIPFGAFGSSQAAGSGFASIGMDLNIDATYYVFRGMGVGIMAGYLYNPANIPISGYPLDTLPNFRSSIGGWNNWYVMGGIGYYNDWGRMIIDYKAMIGASFTELPVWTMNYDKDNQQYRDIYKSEVGVGLLFGGTVGLRYFITRKWAVKGSLTMMFGKAGFQKGTFQRYVDNVPLHDPVEAPPLIYEQLLSWINFNVGISYTIGK